MKYTEQQRSSVYMTEIVPGTKRVDLHGRAIGMCTVVGNQGGGKRVIKAISNISGRTRHVWGFQAAIDWLIEETAR